MLFETLDFLTKRLVLTLGDVALLLCLGATVIYLLLQHFYLCGKRLVLRLQLRYFRLKRSGSKKVL